MVFPRLFMLILFLRRLLRRQDKVIAAQGTIVQIFFIASNIFLLSAGRQSCRCVPFQVHFLLSMQCGGTCQK
jgi:hypothetical protein